MVTNDATVLRIKHDVLYEVAKLAWEGALDEKKEDIPYKLIPGPQARFRCCIYREREIIRQRIRLAEGLCPADGKDTTNIVQVIGEMCIRDRDASCRYLWYNYITDKCFMQ